MMNSSAPTFNCTNRMGRIILLGMEEIIGHNQVCTVLNQASLAEVIQPDPPCNPEVDFSFDKIPQLQATLENVYGLAAGRGLAVRSGRACFKHILREFGAEMGLMGLDYRLLSLPTRLKVGSQSLAALFNRQTGQHVELALDDEYIHWNIEPCLVCGEKRTETSACQLTIGLLQEAMYWVGAGKIFQVEETLCIARGDPQCTLRVRKNPIN